MRTRRFSGAAALTALVVVGLTGCMKIDMQMDLQSDNTVNGTIIYAISKDLAEMMGQDPATLAEERGSEIPTMGEGEEGEYTQEPYEDSEYVGTKVDFTGASIDSLNSSGTSDSDTLTITREGDEFVVTGSMDLSETGDASGLGDMSALTEGMDIRIAVSFPGKVTEHNGELDGNTVTWTPVIGEVLEISARGSAIEGGGGGGDLPIPGIIGAAAALLLIVGLVLFFVLRGRGKKTGAYAAPVAPEGYAMQGYAAPGYATPQAPAAPGYAAPGYAAPGYPAPQAPAAPGYAAPGYAAPGYAAPPVQPAPPDYPVPPTV